MLLAEKTKTNSDCPRAFFRLPFSLSFFPSCRSFCTNGLSTTTAFFWTFKTLLFSKRDRARPSQRKHISQRQKRGKKRGRRSERRRRRRKEEGTFTTFTTFTMKTRSSLSPFLLLNNPSSFPSFPSSSSLCLSKSVGFVVRRDRFSSRHHHLSSKSSEKLLRMRGECSSSLAPRRKKKKTKEKKKLFATTTTRSIKREKKKARRPRRVVIKVKSSKRTGRAGKSSWKI